MITLPSSLIEIGDEAFAHCSGMYNQTVIVPANVERIGKAAFAGTYIKEIRTLEPEYVEEGDADGD